MKIRCRKRELKRRKELYRDEEDRLRERGKKRRRIGRREARQYHIDI